MPQRADRLITNQVCPIGNGHTAAEAERLVIAHAAYAALQAATVALDRVEATVCTDAADPVTDRVYLAVAAHRLTARAALSAALQALQVLPSTLG